MSVLCGSITEDAMNGIWLQVFFGCLLQQPRVPEAGSFIFCIYLTCSTTHSVCTRVWELQISLHIYKNPSSKNILDLCTLTVLRFWPNFRGFCALYK